MSKNNGGFIKYGRPLFILSILVLALGVSVGVVQATLLSTANVIAAPGNLTPSGYTNSQPQIFNETQNVELQGDVICDSVVLPAGTMVNSHMIVYHTANDGIETASGEWEFENNVLCVISSENGLYQALTDQYLGLGGTNYGGSYAGRGKEGNDTVSVEGNTIAVTLTSDIPGDRIRVLTEWSGPEPDTTAPVVYCETVEEEAKGQGQGADKESGNDRTSLVQLFGVDETDGPVELFLTDSESGAEFGPYTVETIVSNTIGNGPAREGNTPQNKTEDVTIRSNGPLMITATDTTGNTGEAMCSQ